MLSRRLTFELAYWTPLVTLLLLSLGLVALKRIKRLSPWLKHLVAPPFYFISLPLATLVVGMEMLFWVIVFFLSGPSDMDMRLRFVGNCFLLSFILAASPWPAIIEVAILGYGLWAALIYSGLVLGRVFLDEEDWKFPAKETERRLMAIILLTAFVWAWVSIRYVIVYWETPAV
jgi:hypothetical protein